MTTETPTRHTPLAALHAELGARMLPFAGFSMPVQYAGGIRHEHEFTRAHAGLFDVSHMGQLAIYGPLEALEDLMPSDFAVLAPYQQRYSVLTDGQGGIIDDLMVTRLPDHQFVVVNAAFTASDFAYLRDALAPRAQVELLAERALLALQGPAAAGVLSALNPGLAALRFMSACTCTLDTIPCIVNRCGYTGEDGFEIALAAADAERLARTLLAQPRVEPAGLGARDSLRLEAGLCLSGTDIDRTTTPIEANLAWVVARKYRGPQAVPARFPGARVILEQLANGPTRLRAGLRPSGRVPLRGGATLHDGTGAAVGAITSGTIGPTAGGPIAMGYLRRECAAAGTRLNVTIRERVHEVTVASLPFVPHRYHQSAN